MGQTAESRPSAYTFGNMAVQTNEIYASRDVEVPEELKTAIGSHLWLAAQAPDPSL